MSAVGETAARPKPAASAAPLLEAVRLRWSPRAFEPRPMAREDLVTVLEAARWAASSANEQPWRFIVALRDEPEAFERALGCLKERNRSWARRASALLFTLARRGFSSNDGENRYAWHDTGMALAQLSLQATALGLQVHPMGGFLRSEVTERYRVPERFEPVVAVAIGYPGDPASLPDDLAARERAPRRRKPLSELVFADAFGEPASLPGIDPAGGAPERG